MQLLEFFIMRVRFTNPFLLLVGSGFALYNIFYPNIVSSFFFGAAFGLIYLNYKEQKNG
jgi:hypothetical protein